MRSSWKNNLQPSGVGCWGCWITDPIGPQCAVKGWELAFCVETNTAIMVISELGVCI